MKIIKTAQSPEYLRNLGVDEDLINPILEYIVNLDNTHKKYIIKNIRKKTDKINNSKNDLLTDINFINELIPFTSKNIIHRIMEHANVDEDVAKQAFDISKEHPVWVAKMITNKSVNPNEDEELVKELLNEFRSLKNSPNIDSTSKNINIYETFGSLAQFVDENSSNKSKRQKFKDQAVSGSKEIHNEDGVRVIELNTPEATATLCKGGNWCVKDPHFAKQHLKDGPMYLFFIDEERSVLVDYPSEIKNKYNSPLKNYGIIKRIAPILTNIGIPYENKKTGDWGIFNDAITKGKYINEKLKDPNMRNDILEKMKKDFKGENFFTYLSNENRKDPEIQNIANEIVKYEISQESSSYDRMSNDIKEATSEEFKQNLVSQFLKTLNEIIEIGNEGRVLSYFKGIPKNIKELIPQDEISKITNLTRNYIFENISLYNNVDEKIKNSLPKEDTDLIAQHFGEILLREPDYKTTDAFPKNLNDHPIIKEHELQGWINISKTEPWKLTDIPKDIIEQFPKELIQEIRKDDIGDTAIAFVEGEGLDPEYIYERYMPYIADNDYSEDDDEEIKEELLNDLYGEEALDEYGDVIEDYYETELFSKKWETLTKALTHFNTHVGERWEKLLREAPDEWHTTYESYEYDKKEDRYREYNEYNGLSEAIMEGWNSLIERDPKKYSEAPEWIQYSFNEENRMSEIWIDYIDSKDGQEKEEAIFDFLNEGFEDSEYDNFFRNIDQETFDNLLSDESHFEEYQHLESFRDKAGEERLKNHAINYIYQYPERFEINPLGVRSDYINLEHLLSLNEQEKILKDSWIKEIDQYPYRNRQLPAFFKDDQDIQSTIKNSYLKKMIERPDLYVELPDNLKQDNELIELYKNRDFWLKSTFDFGNRAVNIMPEEYKNDEEFKNAFLQHYKESTKTYHISEIPEIYKDNNDIMIEHVKKLGKDLAAYPTYTHNRQEVPSQYLNTYIESFIKHFDDNIYKMSQIYPYLPESIRTDNRIIEMASQSYLELFKEKPDSAGHIPDILQSHPLLYNELLEYWRRISTGIMREFTPLLFRQDPIVKKNLTSSNEWWYRKIKKSSY